MRYCLKSTRPLHVVVMAVPASQLRGGVDYPVRGWSWTSSSPTMRHAWSTWRVCAGRKGLCAWAVAGWERSGEHRGGVSSAHTVEGRPRCWREPCSTARARPCVCGFSLPGSSRARNTEPMLSGSSACSDWEAYKTAWVWLHKLRRAMVRPDRDQLSGVVQVDESYVGGVEAGVRGRETIKKAIVAIAAEVDGRKIGRIRLRWVPDLSAPVLRGFVKDSIAPASTVHTDGWPSYQGTRQTGLSPHGHEPLDLRRSRARAHVGRTSGGVSPQALGPRNPPRRDRPRTPPLLSGRVHLSLQPTHIPGSRPVVLPLA